MKSRANNYDLLAENASLLHPEIDEPELYLSFSIDGQIKFSGKRLVQETDNDFEIRQKRANDTIFINKLDRFNLHQARLKLINDKKNELENILIIFFTYTNKSEPNDICLCIKIAFFPFLTRLNKLQEKYQPFSLFGKVIFDNFKEFFVYPFQEQFGDDTAE